MAKLKVTRANGEVSLHQISPSIEYAFELKWQAGIGKMLREHEQNTHLYWLAWECLRKDNVVVPVFGIEFMETLGNVEIVDDEKKL